MSHDSGALRKQTQQKAGTSARGRRRRSRRLTSTVLTGAQHREPLQRCVFGVALAADEQRLPQPAGERPLRPRLDCSSGKAPGFPFGTETGTSASLTRALTRPLGSSKRFICCRSSSASPLYGGSNLDAADQA